MTTLFVFACALRRTTEAGRCVVLIPLVATFPHSTRNLLHGHIDACLHKRRREFRKENSVFVQCTSNFLTLTIFM